jgi:hypothetical protein
MSLISNYPAPVSVAQSFAANEPGASEVGPIEDFCTHSLWPHLSAFGINDIKSCYFDTSGRSY